MSSSDSGEVDNTTSGSRKRKRNVASWKHNAVKTARVQGQAYVSTKGKKVDARTVGPACRCAQKCMQQFTEEEKKDVMSKLYNRTTKNEQDTYLQGLMEVRPIQRHRIRGAENKQERKSNFSYFVMKGPNRIPVCKQAFISLHAITHWQVQRLNTLLLAAKSPKDLRGRHNNRPRAICDEWTQKIKKHIDAFPVKVSHYSSKIIRYLDASLDVRKMHNLFVNKYPELENLVKYEFYLKYFKENFNLKFGRPQVDVCSECERHGTRLRDVNLNDNAKRVAAAELMVHKRRAKKFYNKIKEVQTLYTERPDVMGLAFDYMQNMPLPHIPVQEIFYYRQLWVSAFQIHNIKENTGHFYTYHEGQGHKGPNEVCTFLNDYIMNHIPPEITELHLFSDGCAGQNRNQTMVRFLLALQATKRFKKIYHYFPIRGHSFLPCDRDFGCVKRSFRKHDRIYIPEEYEDMILTSRKKQPFTVKQLRYSDIIDFKNWWPDYYKKTCSTLNRGVGSKRETFAVSNYRQFLYESSSPGYVKTWEYIDGLHCGTFKLLKNTKKVHPSPIMGPIKILYLSMRKKSQTSRR
ncbi:unnamed protein product [Callosobruchus maculatus]|uniref:DUF7869 domain-containing protein n=1 Tax=Callosobruchus maculatus TaxID=64391 RepID=A0A653DNU8_CALMS|nr:unnamed protein product [Callosobruchus maculatus]